MALPLRIGLIFLVMTIAIVLFINFPAKRRRVVMVGSRKYVISSEYGTCYIQSTKRGKYYLQREHRFSSWSLCEKKYDTHMFCDRLVDEYPWCMARKAARYLDVFLFETYDAPKLRLDEDELLEKYADAEEQIQEEEPEHKKDGFTDFLAECHKELESIRSEFRHKTIDEGSSPMNTDNTVWTYQKRNRAKN